MTEREKSTSDDTMSNLDHPNYNNSLWVPFSGDKGSTTMKFALGIGVEKPHICGMFKAADTPINLQIFQAPFTEQLKNLEENGLEVEDVTGETKIMNIELFTTGDKQFKYIQSGLGGTSSNYPSEYSKVTLNHLKKAHLDGSPHTPATCPIVLRNGKQQDQNWQKNQ